jgi:hypothetical protein
MQPETLPCHDKLHRCQSNATSSHQCKQRTLCRSTLARISFVTAFSTPARQQAHMLHKVGRIDMPQVHRFPNLER